MSLAFHPFGPSRASSSRLDSFLMLSPSVLPLCEKNHVLTRTPNGRFASHAPRPAASFPAAMSFRSIPFAFSSTEIPTPSFVERVALSLSTSLTPVPSVARREFHAEELLRVEGVAGHAPPTLVEPKHAYVRPQL